MVPDVAGLLDRQIGLPAEAHAPASQPWVTNIRFAGSTSNRALMPRSFGMRTRPRRPSTAAPRSVRSLATRSTRVGQLAPTSVGWLCPTTQNKSWILGFISGIADLIIWY